MTIEQRAKVYYEQSINLDADVMSYIQGATDQQKIDIEEQADALFIQRQMLIEKACKWLNGNLVETETFDKEWFIGRFKEAMEEAK